MLRRGHELGSRQPGWRYPSARWVAEAERLAALADRLPALLKGEDRPKDVPERLAIGQMCYDTKRYAAAARFWAEALRPTRSSATTAGQGTATTPPAPRRWPVPARGRTTRSPMTPRGPSSGPRPSTG